MENAKWKIAAFRMALVAAARAYLSDPDPGFCRSVHWRLGCAGIYGQRAAWGTVVDGFGAKPVHFLQSRALCYRPRAVQSATPTGVSAVQVCGRRAGSTGGHRVLDTNSRSHSFALCGHDRRTARDLLARVCHVQRPGDDRRSRAAAAHGGADRSSARYSTAKSLAGYVWRGAARRRRESARDGRPFWSLVGIRSVCLRMATEPPGISADRAVVRGLSVFRELQFCLLVSRRSELSRSLVRLARINARRSGASSHLDPHRLAM